MIDFRNIIAEIMHVRIAGCLLLAFVSTTLYGAEVYRTTDANGVVSYSDRPQGDDAQYVRVATPRPATPPPEQTSAPRTETARAAAAPAPIAEPRERTPRERADERAKNCTVARERLQSYTTSHRLYRTLENGQREYLNDDEIDQARARAAADVETWCD
jgi:hypothetical protein